LRFRTLVIVQTHTGSDVQSHAHLNTRRWPSLAVAANTDVDYVRKSYDRWHLNQTLMMVMFWHLNQTLMMVMFWQTC
jgi:hypothetical protein